MSYWCQFCDKEMKLHASVVYELEYITCGASECMNKARTNAVAIANEENMKKLDIIVFSSLTPEDTDSWRMVDVEKYPEFITECPEIVEQMLDEGHVVNVEAPEGCKEPEVFYCIKYKKDVLKQAHEAAGSVK